MKASNCGSIGFGVFEFNPQADELRKWGLKVKVGPQACKVLASLLEHPGQVRTREELRQRLWPPATFVEFEHSLNKAIHALRVALGDSATSPRYIETVAGQGYRFIPILQEISHAVTKRRSPHRIESVAVLPFASESAEPDMPFLETQITSSVIDALSKGSGVRVLAYNTLKKYGPVGGSPQVIGRELGVQGVVAGEITRRDADAILHVELIDVADGAQLLGMRLKQGWPQLKKNPEHVAAEISRRLRSAFNSVQRHRPSTPSGSASGRVLTRRFGMQPANSPIPLKKASGFLAS